MIGNIRWLWIKYKIWRAHREADWYLKEAEKHQRRKELAAAAREWYLTKHSALRVKAAVLVSSLLP